MWVLIALVSLGAVMVVWLRSPAARSDALFGPRTSMAVLSTALAGTALGGAYVIGAPLGARVVRWAVALLLAVLAGGIECVALGGVFTPRDGLDFGVGLLSALAAVAMLVVAIRATRR
jgi:hypothetical protein